MDNQKPKTISVDMTVKEVISISFMAETTLMMMQQKHVPHELIHKFFEEVSPLLDQIQDKVKEAAEKCQKIDKQSAIDDLKIKFTDKESPNGK